MKNLFTVIAVLAVGLIALFIFEYGIEKSEKADCLKWQEEALVFPDYYLTGWQKEMCDVHGIKIVAPIKKLPKM